MECPNFARSDLMACLNYLMEHKWRIRILGIFQWAEYSVMS
jgi:hypothetical protein